MIPTYTSPAAVEAKARADQEAATPPAPVLSSLAGHVRKCWTAAKDHKTTMVTPRLADCRRRRDGQYDAERLAVINEMGGVKTFLNQTGLKCRAAYSWIQDVMFSVDKPWGVDPTPLPDLPREVQEEIYATVIADLNEMVTMTGQYPDEMMGYRIAKSMRDQTLAAIQQEAKERAKRMEDKIADLLLEGGWHESMRQFLDDLTTFPTAIIKGPEVRFRKAMKWDEATGGLAVVNEPLPCFVRVAPDDFYPSPQASSPGDGYVIERKRVTRKELQQLLGVPGYNAKELQLALLTTKPDMASETGDSERAEQEDKQPTILAGTSDDRLEVIEFWGSVQGWQLKEWEMPSAKELDDYRDYDVCLVMVGNHIIKAMLNPDPLGRPPYFTCSFEQVTGSIWGKGLPEIMADMQDAVNAEIRAMLNSLGFASLPQLVVNYLAIHESQRSTVNKIYPGKVHLTKGQFGNMGGRPVDVLQMPDIADKCLRAIAATKKEIDDITGIPAYTYGNEEVGGAGQTASGLNMLMQAASKGIRTVIANVGAYVVAPMIERVFEWVMLNDPDPSIKGDCKINARGMMAEIMREELRDRRLRFANETAQAPVFQQIAGMDGLTKLYRAVSEDLEIDGLVPSDADMHAAAMAQMQQPEPGVTEQASPGGGSPDAGNQTAVA